MNPHLEITEDNLAAMEVFAESNEEPIVMVNLMQVRPHAEYVDPALNDCTGLEAFALNSTGYIEIKRSANAFQPPAEI